MLWQLLGSALHVVAERGQAEGHRNEERLFAEINGVTLSGAIDVQQETPEGLILMDYKFTSVWAVMREKPEWEQQLNIYADRKSTRLTPVTATSRMPSSA